RRRGVIANATTVSKAKRGGGERKAIPINGRGFPIFGNPDWPSRRILKEKRARNRRKRDPLYPVFRNNRTAIWNAIDGTPDFRPPSRRARTSMTRRGRDMSARWGTDSSKTRLTARAMLLAGAMACCAPAYAQSEGSAEEVEETGQRFGETIIVTAERRATNLQDTPLSVVAVTEEIVQAKGIENLADLSTFTPNLNITGGRGSSNSSPYFSIRGVSGGGGATGERGVGLYLDGIYIPRTNGSVLR